MNRSIPESNRLRSVAARIVLSGLLIAASSGCGALLLVGGAGTSAIAFATGELRSSEEVSLETLEEASRQAVERLDYQDVEIERQPDRVRIRARTAGGESVDLRMLARSPERTDLRIRIGVFGDEAASRLLLEEIHQSL